MQPLLFRAFIEALRRDDIQVGVRDYARIRTVFGVRRDWTLTGVRECLRSLLVHDPAKRLAFDHAFQRFFRHSTAGEEIPAIDLEKALEELRSLPEPPPPPPFPPPVPVPPPDRRRIPPLLRTRRWAAVWLTAAAAVVIFLAWWLMPPAVHVELVPASLRFGSVQPGEKKTADIEIVNPSAWRSCEIHQVALSDHAAGVFFLAEEASGAGQTLSPRQHLPVQIVFAPKVTGAHGAKLEVTVKGADAPVLARLSGRGYEVPISEDYDYKNDPPPDFESPVLPGPPLDCSTVPAETRALWRYWLAGSLGCLLLCAGFGVYVYMMRKPPRETPAKWHENVGEQRFSFASVGGQPKPWLRAQQAKRLGDMLGFVPTDAFSPQLNVKATVDATVMAAGRTQLCFRKHVTTRPVMVLEDALAHRDFHSSLIDDLCAGLQDTGVTFTRYRFRGGLARLVDARGAAVELDDLEPYRETHAVLIVSDGSSFRHEAARRSLDRLAHWPRVAWIDLREPQFRLDDDTAAEAGIPTYPATADGLHDALKRFLVAGWQPVSEPTSPSDAAVPLRSEAAGLDVFLESALGEALLWAGDCSLLQPCSEALAERLRERFHPHLPRTRVQRLRRLPGVDRDTAGITFDYRAMLALRRIWLARRSDDDQQQVLRFVVDQLQDARPVHVPPDSLARLTWEAGVERLRLEMDPDNNVKRFARLAGTPVQRYVQASLEGFTADADATGPDRQIPLRPVQRSPRAQQRLAMIDGDLGIPPRERLPVPPRHWLGLGALLAACVLCAAVAWFDHRHPMAYQYYWKVTGQGTENLVLSERPKGQPEFGQIGPWASSSWTPSRPRPRSDSTYRFELPGGPSVENNVPAGQAAVVRVVPPDERTIMMKWIQPGKFLMGSPPDEEGRQENETQHEVTLREGFFLGATEVTQGQYAAVMGENPSRFVKSVPEAPDTPVERVSWVEVDEFCRKLTALEHNAGRLPEEWEYRLPTEAQWEYACRAGTQTPFSYGDSLSSSQANFDGNFPYGTGEKGPYLERTSAAGSYLPNRWGLYDVHGNVWEWCRDGYGDYTEGGVVDQASPAAEGTDRMIRGGSWCSYAEVCRSASRYRIPPEVRDYYLGFRVAAVQVREPGKTEPEGRRRGLELVRVKSGKFTMGSPAEEPGRDDDEQQHSVTLTKGFYIGKYEVTRAQYERVMGENPSNFTGAGPNAPVETVSWEQAMEFCRQLTQKDPWNQLPDGYVYTLPTEAQWEYACRAGSEGPIYQGLYRGPFEILGENNAPALDALAWYGGNSEVTYEGAYDSSDWPEKQYDHQRAGTHPVGLKEPNAWGLHDMLGNVYEWCADWYGEYPANRVTDPTGAAEGSIRVIRGGSWDYGAGVCRSAIRNRVPPEIRDISLDFRVAAVQKQEAEP